jgi:hypothetical protein
MTVLPARITTTMSRFAMCLAIAGCGSHSSGATTDAPVATSLAGPVACGSAACGSGQLCYTQYSGAPDGGVAFQCQTVAAGCTIFDCSGSACPSCAVDSCWYWPELAALFTVMARTVTCEGE